MTMTPSVGTLESRILFECELAANRPIRQGPSSAAGCYGRLQMTDAWKHPIKHAAATNKLPDGFSAYTLRHSVITDLVRGGLPVLTVAQLAGTSVAMIERRLKNRSWASITLPSHGWGRRFNPCRAHQRHREAEAVRWTSGVIS